MLTQMTCNNFRNGFLCIALGVGFGCTANSEPDSTTPESSITSSVLNFALHIPPDIKDLVDHGYVKVSAPDMDDIIVDLVVDSNSITASMRGIPEGNNRLFEIFIFNAADVLTFYGSTTTQVVAGKAITLNIQLKAQLKGNVDVVGVFCDNPNVEIGNPEFVGYELTSNRYDALPPGRLQVVAYYDGNDDGTTHLSFELISCSNSVWLKDTIHASSWDGTGKIYTAEFDLNGYEPSGQVTIEGVVPNGVIDGVGVGLFWRDQNDGYHLLQSRTPGGSVEARFVGIWPMGMIPERVTTQISPNAKTEVRDQVMTTLFGSELWEDGTHNLNANVFTQSGSCLDETVSIARTNDLGANLNSYIPSDHLQVTTFYDGSGSDVSLQIQCVHPSDGKSEWLSLSGIPSFGTSIPTREFALNGCEPTGVFDVQGIVPNGVIDGLAFGMLWRNTNGQFRMFKSQDSTAPKRAQVFGMWPIQMSHQQFHDILKGTVTESEARLSARGMLLGAGYVQNGCQNLAP